MNMLNINNLTKKFGNKIAVNDVSFAVKPGEIFSLIGPNGSGKTTIVKTITGLLQADSGSIAINKHDVKKEPEKAKSFIGYIPDEPIVWPYMTGFEFLNFTEALFSMTDADYKKRAKELLSIFKLQGLENKYFEDYSRGNKQKFSIIAALSHNPNLLIIDEPIVGLDPVSAEIAEKLFLEFSKNGGSILLVTHTLSVAEKISNRIGILKKGELKTLGTQKELIKKANLKEGTSLNEIYKALAV